MPKQIVVAQRAFQYDATLAVRQGQVFELREQPNDPLLLKHGHVAQYAGTAAEMRKLPQCGTCGAYFLEEWQRDRCGEAHLYSPAERQAMRRARAQERVLETRRTVAVGA